MSLIHAHNLVKSFMRTKRTDGRFSAVQTLFTRERETTIAFDRVSYRTTTTIGTVESFS